MNKFLHKFLGIFLISSMALSGCAKQASANTEKKKVIYTSFFPVTDLTKRIVKDKMEVKQIINGNQEPHDFELQTKDMTEISKADLVIYNGAGIESFIHDLKEISKAEDKFVDLSKGLTLLEAKEGEEHHHHHGEEEEHHDEKHHEGEHHEEEGEHVNPHTWLSIKNVLKELPSIYEAVKKIDPANEAFYKENLEKAIAEFKALDEKFTTELAKLPANKEKIFVTSHAAFDYLANDYGLTQVPVAGISQDEEPSAQKLKELADYVKEHHISTVFFEGKATPKVAETLAKETGVKTDVLNTLEMADEEEMKLGYIGLMEQNLNALVKSFNE